MNKPARIRPAAITLTPAAVRRHLENLTDSGLIDEREAIAAGAAQARLSNR